MKNEDIEVGCGEVNDLINKDAQSSNSFHVAMPVPRQLKRRLT